MAEFTPLWQGGPLFAQAAGQRLSTDCVLLADFVRPSAARRGIDLGCGSGAVALLLLTREGKLHMTGLELDAGAAAVACENMRVNALTERSRIVTGDIRRCGELFPAGSFDLAVSNPPYFPPGRGRISPDPARAAARSESSCTLQELCLAARRLLRSGGSFSLVHRPERLSEVFCAMSAAGTEPKRLRLVYAAPGRAPSLVLIEGRRDGRPGLEIEPPLILRDASGQETEEYRRIFRRV